MAVFVVVWSSLMLVKQVLAEGRQRLHGFQQSSHYENSVHLDAPP